MKLDLHGRKNIYPLRNVPRSFLQVLLTSFALTKREGGLILDVDVTEDLLSLVDGRGKRELFHAVAENGGTGRDHLAAEIEKFRRNDRILSYRFDCAAHPLRYANGGVLPLVRLDGRDYFCLFYRDVFPIGWNIANGASDTTDEMLDPARIILREFGEELLICDREPGKEKLYTFDPGQDNVSPGFHTAAIKAWSLKFPDAPIEDYERLPTPLKWLVGPDRVRARMGNAKHMSEGYFVNITPEDNAIEVDRIALINLKGSNLVFFDGEYTQQHVLDRVVGLFSVARMKNEMGETDFRPHKIFREGRDQSDKELDEVVVGFLSELDTIGYRSPDDRNAYEAEPHKYALCPIARAMIARYFNWVDRLAPPPDVAPAPFSECDVFISHRSPDMPVAVWLHEFLANKGYKVFCSAESLPRLGGSDYAQVIDKALESAKCLVVLGTKPDYFDSGWVGYEWRSFLNEIRSGRKPHGRLFTLAAGVSVDQLPYALRSLQMIPFSASSPQDAFESLAAFISRVSA